MRRAFVGVAAACLFSGAIWVAEAAGLAGPRIGPKPVVSGQLRSFSVRHHGPGIGLRTGWGHSGTLLHRRHGRFRPGFTARFGVWLAGCCREEPRSRHAGIDRPDVPTVADLPVANGIRPAPIGRAVVYVLNADRTEPREGRFRRRGPRILSRDDGGDWADVSSPAGEVGSNSEGALIVHLAVPAGR